MRRALSERRRGRPHWLLHKKDYIYKIFRLIHDISDVFLMLSWSRSNSFSRIAVRSVCPCEIRSTEPIQNERSIWSLIRVLSLYLQVTLFRLSRIPRNLDKSAGPLNLLDHRAVSSRCTSSLLLRSQLRDIVAFLRWSGSVTLRVWQSFFTQRLVVQCCDWWSLPVMTS